MSAPPRRLRLVPPPPRARRWLFALLPCLPLAFLAAGAVAQAPEGQAARLQLALAALLLVSLWWLLDRVMQRQQLRITARELDVRSSFYRCRVELQALDLARARLVDLDEHTTLRPLLKVNGFSLPGLRSGWYRLRNGRRGFVATAGGRRVLWLPGTGRHDLLLEVDDPGALLSQLRELAAATPRH